MIPQKKIRINILTEEREMYVGQANPTDIHYAYMYAKWVIKAY